jgi:hypothetical protein
MLLLVFTPPCATSTEISTQQLRRISAEILWFRLSYLENLTNSLIISTRKR